MFSVKEIESGAIFEKCTIQEISDVEKKLRQDIEKKKEDLRQMVGERYRELIEAADTITDMKNGTEKVASSITHLQELCQSLKQSSIAFHKGAHQSAIKTSNLSLTGEKNKFNHSVCMKLLMDIPNKIWSHLDKKEYLKATKTFLIAQHIHGYLRSGIGQQSARLVNILVRQWTAINHLKTTIIKNIEAKLKDAHISEELVGECLSSSILLQELSIDEVFKKFLKFRIELVRQYFESYGLDVTIKPLICDIVTTLLVTLRQVHVIFLGKKDDEENQGLLISKLEDILSSDNLEYFESGVSLSDHAKKYLPPQVFGFKLSLKFELRPIEQSFLTTQSSEFVKSCSQLIHEGVGGLLDFVTSIKSLACLRDEIYIIDKKNSETCDWSALCNDVIGRDLDLWSELLRKHFLDRLKSLLENQMDSVVMMTESQISKTLEDFADVNNKSLSSERNLSNFIWSESVGDIPPNAAWMPLNQKLGGSIREGGLHMKAKGYTPGVQSLCQSIDQKMKALLEEVISYVNPAVFQSYEATPTPHQQPANENQAPPSLSLSVTGFISSMFSASSSPSAQSSLEEHFADRNDVQELLQDTCASYLYRTLKFLKQQSSTYKLEIVNSKNSTNSSITLDRILYIGKISTGLSDLSPSLQSCMSDALVDDSTPSAARMTKPTKLLTNIRNKVMESKKWTDISQQFTNFSQDVYMVWSDHMVSSLSEQFRSALFFRGDHSHAAYISSCTQWDTIAIEEENEEGKIVKSNIKVPMQASWCVHDLLYNLCMHVNRIGGHVVYGSTVSNLTKKLISNILTYYNELLSSSSSSSSSLHQSRALQMWFDVKFLIGILSTSKDEMKASDINKTAEDVVEILESHVDPFDLDVFRSYLKKHLTRQLQRTSVLYGLALPPDRSSFSSSILSTSSGQQEQHHVVPMSAGPNRFPLLPWTQQNKPTMEISNTSKLAQKTLDTINSSSIIKTFNTASPYSSLSSSSTQNQLAPPPPPPPRASSSSFLEQMSTLFGSSSTTLYIK